MCCKTRVTEVWDFNLVVHIVAHIDQRVRPTGASSVASHVMLACCGSTMCCYSQFSFSSILLLLRSTFCLFLMGFIYVSIEGFQGFCLILTLRTVFPAFYHLLFCSYLRVCFTLLTGWLRKHSPPLSDTTGLPSPLRWIPESCFILPAAPLLSLVERKSP